jgi:hypothetical protein
VVLNENYDFDRSTPPDVRASFRTPPSRVLLRQGENLRRFVTMGHNETIAGFWIPGDTYQKLEEWARQLAMPIQHLARNLLAVTMEWNPKMNGIFVAELKSDAYGLRGPAKYQRLEENNPKVLLIGNLDQVWIPNLSASTVFQQFRTL